MKINLGSGPNSKTGYLSCDSRKLPNVDKVFDFEVFPYPFKDSSVEEIYSCETFEHLSWRAQSKVFEELFRILKPKGLVNIQVPDIGEMCRNYVNNEICDCVPHKSETDTFHANPDCPKCLGKGKINPTRWVMAFCGAQKHPWDYHKTMFTKESMTNYLTSAGFTGIEYIYHPYKIKVKAIK